MTIKEATELWVRRDMIPVPESVVEKLFKISEGADISEITPPAIGNRVTYPIDGEIVDVQQNPDGEYSYLVRDDSDPDSEEFYSAGVIGVERDDYLPMWGTLWAFSDSFDKEWLDNPDNLQAMANCGFRIYESEDYGYLFGIDGAGYDFYEQHWIPLYKARGLMWHGGGNNAI